MSPLETSILKFVVPAAGSVIVLAKFRKGPLLAETLHFPSMRASVPWFAAYLGWMLVTDAVLGWRGPWDFEPWLRAPLASSILRCLAVVVAGPLLEELVFRGLAFAKLQGTRVGPTGAVVITAIFWSLLHWSYTPAEVAIIMVAGLILGAARWRTGSLFLPIAMHMSWNLYAVW